MVGVDWNAVLRETLFDVLGDPLSKSSDKLYWPGRETTRGDNSRSFTYTLSGPYAGTWYDWSASIGGRSVFKFLNHWHGWEKERAVEFLKGRCILPADDEFVPTEEWKKCQHLKRKVEWEHKGNFREFGDAIARDAVAFQKTFELAWHNSLKHKEANRRRKLVSNAWSDARCEMLESLLLLAEQVSDERVDIAIHTLCAARSFCMEILGEHGCFPEIGEKDE